MASNSPIIQTVNKNRKNDSNNFLDDYKPTRTLGNGTTPPRKAPPEPDGLPPSPKKPRRRALKIILAIIIIAIVGLAGFVAIRASNLADKIFVGKNTDFYHKITDLISSQTGGNKLLGEKEGQVNVLLLGIGGAGHDGPYLSDTIMVAQIKPNDNKATLISIPRDYLVNTKELGQRKINAVFAESFAKNKSWEEAGNATISVVETLSGLEIPYFAVIDFEGFRKTIDLLGGVDVTIEKGFTDYTFPNDKEGYLPAVTFKEGTETMDGKRALIYARSRHAAGSEGSDFARSARQQQIIQAAKTKIVSLNIISNAGKINELFSIVGDHFHTNLSAGELIRLYSLTKDYNKEQVISLSLDPTSNIICPQTLESNGAYVLTLCAGKTAQDVKNFFTSSFDTGAVLSEKATIWLADSTVSQKLYKKTETELKNNGFTVFKVIYTGKPITQNLVYSVNQKPATLDFIKQRLNASEVSLAPAGIKIDPAKVDIIIILGQTATTTTP